jgi:predicted RNA-binding protein with RPS1 domain
MNEFSFISLTIALYVFRISQILNGSARVNLFVKVIDVDDNNPKFSVSLPNVYTLEVTEEVRF